MPRAPKVFISYSHDNSAHKEWVRRLATDLRANGVDASLDLWDLSPGQDIARFMERGIVESDRVLVVCTPPYVYSANSGMGGVGYERLIITAEIVANIDTRKFIPIVRNNPERGLPTCLGPRYFVDLNSDEEYQVQLEQLLREIHQIPALERPSLGPNPYFRRAPAQPVEHPRLPFGAGQPATTDWDDSWFRSEREKANAGLLKAGLTGAMELCFALSVPISKRQNELLDAAYRAQVHTFGWPLASCWANGKSTDRNPE